MGTVHSDGAQYLISAMKEVGLHAAWRQLQCDHELVQTALGGLHAAQQGICGRLGLHTCPNPFAPARCNETWLNVAVAALFSFLVLLLLSRVFK